MSLDGGYIGSIDHAIANLHTGRRQGHQQGIEEGYQQGYQQGYQEGYQQGDSAGWDAGVAAGNVHILKQMEYTRQHIAEKERFMAGLVRQRELIDQLEAKVADLDAKYREKFRQYNRCLVFINSVCRVLADLTSEDTPQAKRVRELFAEKYAQQVSKALETGGIKAPPENDSEFAKSLPQIRQFILNMLQSVGR